jgi:hypothetical protein
MLNCLISIHDKINYYCIHASILLLLCGYTSQVLLAGTNGFYSL